MVQFAGDYPAAGQFMPDLDAVKQELASLVAGGSMASLCVTPKVGDKILG